ncbi:hypothetical protein K402DRAFT_450032 [Aulographum hederae CBS 113979]|uniref:Uncharacterized protein n=1 Tax=Aulographum hederae CBS 113979 TaxID=1176131 RepID=A0A6G1HF43_9PEZI|nr:hypothetical protein K402DRAFT_450032 [Aulographum hederae CBS 113979]
MDLTTRNNPLNLAPDNRIVTAVAFPLAGLVATAFKLRRLRGWQKPQTSFSFAGEGADRQVCIASADAYTEWWSFPEVIPATKASTYGVPEDACTYADFLELIRPDVLCAPMPVAAQTDAPSDGPFTEPAPALADYFVEEIFFSWYKWIWEKAPSLNINLLGLLGAVAEVLIDFGKDFRDACLWMWSWIWVTVSAPFRWTASLFLNLYKGIKILVLFIFGIVNIIFLFLVEWGRYSLQHPSVQRWAIFVFGFLKLEAMIQRAISAWITSWLSFLIGKSLALFKPFGRACSRWWGGGCSEKAKTKEPDAMSAWVVSQLETKINARFDALVAEIQEAQANAIESQVDSRMSSALDSFLCHIDKRFTTALQLSVPISTENLDEMFDVGSTSGSTSSSLSGMRVLDSGIESSVETTDNTSVSKSSASRANAETLPSTRTSKKSLSPIEESTTALDDTKHGSGRSFGDTEAKPTASDSSSGGSSNGAAKDEVPTPDDASKSDNDQTD